MESCVGECETRGELSRLLLYNVARYGRCMLGLTIITFEKRNDQYVRQDRMKRIAPQPCCRRLCCAASAALSVSLSWHALPAYPHLPIRVPA